ncbi:hypothetical protein CVIRNUC_010935 [Coccomyxa viridis]|uniref:Uncharacterized protein n=1 Tax=Coccomyxa viridis TaxID=1274662 RepID=A0AAV1IK70_9CHLO|nr:hypothetical protein CVIRNUC_010935 [Coccomyxa viridis]
MSHLPLTGRSKQRKQSDKPESICSAAPRMEPFNRQLAIIAKNPDALTKRREGEPPRLPSMQAYSMTSGRFWTHWAGLWAGLWKSLAGAAYQFKTRGLAGRLYSSMLLCPGCQCPRATAMQACRCQSTGHNQQQTLWAGEMVAIAPLKTCRTCQAAGQAVTGGLQTLWLTGPCRRCMVKLAKTDTHLAKIFASLSSIDEMVPRILNTCKPM